jgi:hypothetical protein
LFPGSVNRNPAAQFLGRGGSRTFRIFSRGQSLNVRDHDGSRTNLMVNDP